MTEADRIARELDEAAAQARSIRAVSRKDLHAFVEDKDALARRLVRIAADLRNTFGGPATQFRSGQLIATRRGREIRVETRKAA